MHSATAQDTGTLPTGEELHEQLRRETGTAFLLLATTTLPGALLLAVMLA